VRTGIHSWEEYLPPLNPSLEKLVETYDAPSAPAGQGEQFARAIG
jgi:hypothetical protein